MKTSTSSCPLTSVRFMFHVKLWIAVSVMVDPCWSFRWRPLYHDGACGYLVRIFGANRRLIFFFSFFVKYFLGRINIHTFRSVRVCVRGSGPILKFVIRRAYGPETTVRCSTVKYWCPWERLIDSRKWAEAKMIIVVLTTDSRAMEVMRPLLSPPYISRRLRIDPRLYRFESTSGYELFAPHFCLEVSTLGMRILTGFC
jgi:hypothetical protein